jgi:hypothetical protein
MPRLMAVESATLVVLAASLLVFRTFRERSLLIWIVGWLAYFVSGWTLRSFPGQPPAYAIAISQSQFVLAIGLFAAAIFVYSHARKLLVFLFGFSGLVIAYALLRALLWPDSFTLRLALEIAYRVITLAAAVQLVRFRWARWEIGSWLLAFSLLFVHLDWTPLDAHLPSGISLVGDLVFGLSMLIVIFDDSKTRTQRLHVINSLTSSISRAQQYGPMLATAMEELKNLMLAKAAWFRLQEDGKMLIVQQIGLSSDFLRDRGSVASDDNFEQTLSVTAPIVLRTSRADDSVRPYLKRERFNHVVLVPVQGKKTSIGILALGSRHRLCYKPEDLEFMATCAYHLGLAVEILSFV